jgi:HK97 family phage prohead protease
VFYNGAPGTEFQIFPKIVERISPSAFDRALRENQDVAALFNHDPNWVLGRNTSGTMRLGSDGAGLRYEIDLDDTSTARDVAAYVKRGDVTGSSFTFIPVATERRVDGDTVILTRVDVNLIDVGPVTFPAYTGTTAGMRSESLLEEARAAIAESVACRDVRERRIREMEIQWLDVIP